MPFPLVKLGYLFLRQISKHFATALKSRTAKSPRFKSFCHSLANWYHSRDVNAKLNLLGLGKSSSVHKLDPNRAEELATALMGEVFTYIIFATLVYAEYSYVAKGSEIKEQQKKEEWNRMERRIEDITMITEKQEAEIMELRRILQTLEERNHSLAKKFFRKEKNG